MHSPKRLSTLYRLMVAALSLALFRNSASAGQVALAASLAQAGQSATPAAGEEKTLRLPLVVDARAEAEAAWLPTGYFLAFGPQDYVRTGGSPNVFSADIPIPNPNASYTLRIYNGGVDENFEPIYDPVSSAVITFNGVQVAGPSDFKKQVSLIERPVTPLATNQLVVELRSGPGVGLTIMLVGVDNDLPSITPTIEPPANAAGWHNAPVTVHFACADATSAIVACSEPVTVSTEGAGQVVTGEATDLAGNHAMTSVAVNLDMTAPAITDLQPADGSTLDNPRPTFSGVFADALSGVDGASVQLLLNGDDVTAQAQVSASGFTFTPAQDLADGNHTLAVSVRDVAGNSAAASTTVTVLTVDDGLPPDPATIAPPLDLSVATDVVHSTEFLYTGENPIQTGVAPGTIDAVRGAVLRGQVFRRDGAPLSGVTITVKDHPEYGQTLSRADGAFDLAVNGGSVLVVNYEKEGFLPVQRQVEVAWQSFAFLPDVVMIPLDSQVTTIDLSAPDAIQVARGSVVTDADGAWQATLFFPQGIQAEMVLPDGSTQALTTLNVRATEYTVGENGPEAMPGELPPQIGYTYAAEFSVDEALAVNATEVRFSQPVIFYLENFIGFPAGGIVPVGYYDRTLGKWVPSPNGRIIQIVGITDGLADVDTDGDGQADSGVELGITDAERAQLAALYTPGQSLWRVPISHFTPWDCNWPYTFPSDAQTFPQACRSAGLPAEVCDRRQGGGGAGDQDPGKEKEDEPCESLGSIIECQNQTLRERIEIAGTPFSLNYASDRTLVHNRRELEILVSPPVVPASLQGIELEISVLGQRIYQSFSAAPNQTFRFTWDGRDAYGRVVQGSFPVEVRHRYIYGAVYTEPAQMAASFGRFGGSVLLGVDRLFFRVSLETRYTDVVSQWDARGQGLGRWTLSPHHVYDPNAQTLYRGDGTRTSTNSLLVVTRSSDVIETIAGTGVEGPDPAGLPATETRLDRPTAVATAPDGTIYIAESSLDGVGMIRRIAPDGTTQLVAGGILSFADGVPATQTNVRPLDITFGPDGDLYIADTDHHCIRRIDDEGIIHAVVGVCRQGGFDGDGGPASAAKLFSPIGIDFAADGTLYIADSGNRRIRQVTPDGIITTIAGTGASGTGGDGGPALLATLTAPQGIDVVPSGAIYVVDASRVRRIRPDGIIELVAGGGSNVVGEGILATQAGLSGATDVAVFADGGMIIVDSLVHRVRYVTPNGNIFTIAGQLNLLGFTGDGGPANRARLRQPRGVTIGVDGNLYVADSFNHAVRRLAKPLPTLFNSLITLPAPDDSEFYQFDLRNRHVRTLDGLTNAVRYRFDYDEAGRLVAITDANDNVTRIERDNNGNPVAIVGPYGHRTTLTLNPDGLLAAITDPAGQTYRFTYHEGGLLATLTDPRDQVYTFTYNASGRLIEDRDPAGGFTALSRTDGANGYTVHMQTALGRTTQFKVEHLPNGDVRRTTVDPNGATTSVLTRANGMQELTNPDGTQVTLSYSPDPRWGILSLTSPATTIRLPGGLTYTSATLRTATLGAPGDPLRLQSLTDVLTVNGRTYRSVYDASTRTMTSNSPEGRQMISVLDEQGRVVQAQLDPALAPAVYTYDSRGRLQQSQQGDHTLTYTYDERGRIASITDAAGNVVRFEYDDADRLIRKVLPSQRAFRYGYDANGNLTSVILPSGLVHQLAYTPVNLNGSYTAPGAATGDTRTYDLDRGLDLLTLAGGRAVDYSYDNGGRITGLTYPEATISFTYNDATQRVRTISRTPATGPAQSITYGYNGFLVATASWSGAANGSFQYSYDNNFFLTSLRLDGQTLGITRDADGLVTGYGPFTFTRGGPSGAQSRIQDNALEINLGYDTLARLDARTHAVNGQTVYALNLDYENIGHNRTGRIQRRTETIAGETHIYTYTYDVDGQLTAVHRDGVLVEAYTYDSDGNRTATLTTTAEYDSRGMLSRLGETVYEFDADGFLVRRGADTFQYGARGELLQAILGNGQTITYAYDGLGRRVARTDSAGTIQYLYGDPGDVFRVTHVRDRGGNLISLFYDEAGYLFAFEQGGARFYVATDQVGTPKVVTDASGAPVKTLAYDSFGALLADSNPALELPIGYAGGLADPATGLVRFGWRDYDPAAGRWTAHDPILFDGGQENLYVYVSNDPINLRDPLGLFCIGGSLYALIGGGAEICFNSKGFSICGEIGLGAGGGFGISNDDPRRNGNQISAEAEVGCPGVGIKAGVTLKDCGDFDPVFEGGVGPFKVGLDNVGVENAPKDDGPKKCGLGGKVAAKFCGGF